MDATGRNGIDVRSNAGKPSIGWDIWAVVAAFGAYFCMYMYRKPFTVASFETMTAFGMAYKPLAIISQVLGYTISKFIGIKVVSEAEPAKRYMYFLGMILVAEIALVLFGLTPAPFNLFWLFVNGLPLGMVFGFVLAYLEGRVRTELLTAGLCASFIIADGVAKSSGSWLMSLGVQEIWMPSATGALFIPGIILFAWMLSKIPPPSQVDVMNRSERAPMDAAARRQFLMKYAMGFSMLVGIYALVGVLRGVRGDFAKEIWDGLHFKVDPGLFSVTEIIIAFSVLVVIAVLVLIKDNQKAFNAGLALAGIGFVIVIGSLLGLQFSILSPFLFVVLIGFGLYLPYIAIHATVFERLIAFTKERGTIGYLMYVSDAASYALLVGLLFFKNLGDPKSVQILPFFIGLAWIVALACLAMLWPTFSSFNKLRRSL